MDTHERSNAPRQQLVISFPSRLDPRILVQAFANMTDRDGAPAPDPVRVFFALDAMGEGNGFLPAGKFEQLMARDEVACGKVSGNTYTDRKRGGRRWIVRGTATHRNRCGGYCPGHPWQIDFDRATADEVLGLIANVRDEWAGYVAARDEFAATAAPASEDAEDEEAAPEESAAASEEPEAAPKAEDASGADDDDGAETERERLIRAGRIRPAQKDSGGNGVVTDGEDG